LSNNDYDVVVGYVIPRNYEYIQKKTAGKEEDAVSDTHRQKMVDMAAQGTFLKVLPLEDMLKHPNMSQQEIRAHIQKMHPSAEIIFVAGDDKAQCQPGEDACLKDDPVWGKYVVVSRGLAGGASSTDVRNHLKKTGDEKNLLRPTVRDYIHQNHLWGARGATV
jgi:nicotinic acid mononucleotide adenylyltransferase